MRAGLLTKINSGECAQHFQQILAKYPPQVRTRSNAAAWACFVHNEVNMSLKKEEFDCSKIGDFYDCGCAEDEDESRGAGSSNGKSKEPEIEKGTRRRGKTAADDGRIDIEVQRNG